MGRELFVVYRRSSTPGKGLSREAQWRSIEAYIRRIGGELIASYEDVGSATYTLKGLARAQPNDPPVGEPEVLDELGVTNGLDFFTCFVSDN